MSKEVKNTLLLQGSILAAAGIFTKLIGFLYRIPMANLLGNQGNGVYSVAFGIYTVTLTLSSMSLPTAVSKVVSARLARGEDRNAARVLAVALLFALAMGAFSFSLLYFGAHILEGFYQTEGLWRPLRVLAPTSFLFAFLGVMRGYTQGSGSMVPTAVSQIVDQCFNAVISIAAAWALLNVYGGGSEAASWGAMGGTLGTLAGAVASFLFMAVFMVRRLPEIRLRARRDASPRDEDAALAAKALALTILPIVFSQTVYQIGYTIDDMVFSRFMNGADVDSAAVTSMQGVFNTQYNQMVNLPVSIATAMAMTLMPSIVASHVRRERREVHHKITGTVKFNMAIAIPCAVGLAVLADPLMALLFPSLGEYHDLAAHLRKTRPWETQSTMHGEVEAALDAIVLRRETGMLPSEVHLKRMFPKNEGVQRRIAKLYAALLLDLYGEDVPEALVLQATRDAHLVFALLNDRTGLKRQVFQRLERGKPGKITSHLVPITEDDGVDYANIQRQPWGDPPSSQNFFDLMDQAENLALELIRRFQTGDFARLTGERPFG